MAQRYFPLDLAVGNFPFISKDKPRTVMVNSSGYLTGNEAKPAVLYGHNVMPSDAGYEAVGYTSRVAAATADTALAYFVDVRRVYDEASNNKYLGFDSLGTCYILDASNIAAGWVTTGILITEGDFDATKVSIGDVQGISYICYSQGAVYTLATNNTLTAITLTSLEMSEVLGIIGSSGYLIAYTDKAVAWSSTIDPTDFDPSDVTGAGGGNINNTIGSLLFATVNTYGFLLYAEGNIITAVYTGNSSYPFKFTALQNSSGCESLHLTTYKSNYDSQFAYTKAGLQSITYSAAETVLPEATDFLSGRLLEDFDDTTKEFTYSYVDSIAKRLNLVASRYLVASYGIPSLPYYTHALVYDIALGKLGKLKANHIDVIELLGEQPEIAKQSIGLVSLDGSINTVDFSSSSTAYGTLILGKLQYSHTSMIKLLGAEFENLAYGDTIEVGAFTSVDGKNFSYAAGALLNAGTNWLRTYGFMSSGKNHSLLITGRFNLNTVLVKYATAGRH